MIPCNTHKHEASFTFHAGFALSFALSHKSTLSLNAQPGCVLSQSLLQFGSLTRQLLLQHCCEQNIEPSFTGEKPGESDHAFCQTFDTDRLLPVNLAHIRTAGATLRGQP